MLASVSLPPSQYILKGRLDVTTNGQKERKRQRKISHMLIVLKYNAAKLQ